MKGRFTTRVAWRRTGPTGGRGLAAVLFGLALLPWAGCTCPDGKVMSCDHKSCLDPEVYASDPNNCGACGHECSSSEVCSSGVCRACPAGEARCNAVCVDLQTSQDHCGSCDISCEEIQVCDLGTCLSTPPG